MARKEKQKRGRPVFGGIVAGIFLSLMVGYVLLGLSLAAAPWVMLAGAVGGGGLAVGAGTLAGESVVVSVIEAILSAIGEVFGAIFGFIGDLFSGFSL